MNFRKDLRRRGTSLFLAFLLAFGLIFIPNTKTYAAAAPTVTYGVHVQNIGDQRVVTSGGASIATAGTTGRALRLESIHVKLNTKEAVHVQYRTHVQNIGWMPWVSDDDESGTRGHSLRLEAIQMKLTGADAGKYDIYYRVHAQDYGWLTWAKNGAAAGTAGASKRLEAIQIIVTAKGAAPSATSPAPAKQTAYYDLSAAGIPVSSDGAPHVVYAGHIQNQGNSLPTADGATLGSVGKGQRLEAFSLRLTNLASGEYAGSGVTYKAHVQNIGWQSPVSNGAVAGTMGRSLRMESVNIKLTGKIANDYDLLYRVHVQNVGWQSWVRGGQNAGTAGSGRRIEAIQIRILKRTYIDQYASIVKNTALTYTAQVQGSGWQGYTSSGNTAGTTGQSKGMTAIKCKITGNKAFSVTYAAVSGGKWGNSASNDAPATGGAAGSNIEACKFQLTGDADQLFDIYYRAHVQNLGWLDWACNGAPCGTKGMGYRMEAIQIKLVEKGAGAPGSTTAPYWDASVNKGKKIRLGNKLYCFDDSGKLKRTVDGSKPMVALTYDDGPADGTSIILNTLSQYNSVATFYVIGNRANGYRDVIKRAHNMGCEIDNHSWSHPILSSQSASTVASEISQCDSVISGITGTRPKTLRPPGGGYNDTVLSVANRPVIMWSIDTLDWKTLNSQSTINAVLGNVRDGDVVLMHDLHMPTATASQTIIPTLVGRGYQLVTVEELSMFRGGMSAGHAYRSFYR